MEWCTVLLWIVVGLMSTLYLFFQKKFGYWKDRGVHFLEPKIPFGNLPFVKTEHLKNIIGKLYESKNGRQFMGAYFFIKPIVVATDLDFVKDVLIKDFNKFHDRGVYVNEEIDPLGAHLFSLDGQKWRSLRAKLTPTFTSGKMKFMYPTVVEVSERFNKTLVDILRTERTLEMKELLARFTTDIIGTCAFGIECNSLKDPNAEFRIYGRKIFEEPALGTLGRVVTTQFPELSRKLKLRFTPKDVSDFFLQTVRETIEFREKNNVRRNDFMDLLIQLKNNESLDDENSKKLGKLSLEEVAAQAFLFFLAGFETSSTTMLYSLYELSFNADIQDKARREIENVLLKHNGELTYDAVKDMKYVDQIINEALRKYPPVVVLIRKAVEDYSVSNSSHPIEKGTTIFIPVYSIHHDPDIYPDPEVYDPDRFSTEQQQGRHPMAFLGFGEGPRNCIGLRFGMMQSRVGLIMLLRNYRFKPSSKTPKEIVFSTSNPILSPVGGLYLDVEKIQ